jgi:hypothetical protein
MVLAVIQERGRHLSITFIASHWFMRPSLKSDGDPEQPERPIEFSLARSYQGFEVPESRVGSIVVPSDHLPSRAKLGAPIAPGRKVYSSREHQPYLM